MKLRRLILLHGLALAVTLNCRAAARAESAITIYPAGSGCFSVQGNLPDKVATLEITVVYDAGTLSDPSASCGPLAAKAHCEINSETSGIVQIRISSATLISGLGNLASLNFTRQGDEPGTINSLDARLTDSSGDSLPAKALVVNPAPDQYGRPAPMLREEEEPDSLQPAPHQAGGTTQLVTPDPVAGKDTARTEAQPAANTLPYHRLESVLERFRGRPDSTTLDSLLPLFESVREGRARQEPPVVLSDGGSTARLTMTFAGNGNKTPTFALQGARFISLWKGDGSEWTIEVLPDKGVYAASLTILSDAAMTEYPLTVAPPLDPPRKELGPADFARWRQDRSRPKSAAETGAARPGYVEDYIYVANYIAGLKAEGFILQPSTIFTGGSAECAL
jgi:hypothetical protein